MDTQYLDSLVSGIVEGLTEFAPVSSTGHLILTDAVLDHRSAASGVFDIFIQIGAIAAILWARRERLRKMLTGLFDDKNQRLFALKIAVAFLPAAFAGALLHNFIKTVLFSPWVVAVSLIAGGIFMLFAEKIAPPEKIDGVDSISLPTAFKIGICQVLALVPGVSRAGASIVGARLLGVEMKTAAEFSFFLAIPTIFGAAAFDLYKSYSLLTRQDIPFFAIGTLAAFFSALLVVNRLIAFIGRYGFRPFGYYRIAIGALVLFLLAAGFLGG